MYRNSAKKKRNCEGISSIIKAPHTVLYLQLHIIAPKSQNNTDDKVKVSYVVGSATSWSI